MQEVDPRLMRAWVAEHADVDEATVRITIVVEYEYMAVVGIAVPPDDYEFVYFQPGQFRATRVLDEKWLGEEIERLTSIPKETAWRVLAAESEFLELRGL